LIAAGEVPGGRCLPPVLPLVLYNGEARWWAKTHLAGLGAIDRPGSDVAPNRGEGAAPTATTDNRILDAPTLEAIFAD